MYRLPTTWSGDLARTRIERRRVWIAGRLIDAVLIVVLLAAAAKLLDLPRFYDALKTWDVIPSSLTGILTLTVPGIELTLAGAGVLGLARGAMARAVAVLLIIFTIALLAQLATGRAPDCGCFGRLLRFESAMDEARFSVARNIMLLGVLLGACILRRSGCSRGVLNREPIIDRQATSGRGFTLVELIIVIAIIGILVAQLTPTLALMRDRANNMRDLSNLRSHIGVFGVYTNDWRDTFPYFMHPVAGNTYTVLHAGGNTFAAPYYFFGSSYMWNVALADMYYNGNYQHESFYRPGVSPIGVGAQYKYGCCFIAHPDYWNPERRTGSSQWLPTTADEVTYPSAKGLFLIYRYTDARDYYEYGYYEYGVGVVDGSAEFLSMPQLNDGYTGGDGTVGGHIFPTPVRHTIDGVRGRDKR
jgi:prepilin-type N-terminal cleavage/methylation domain-containing protein